MVFSIEFEDNTKKHMWIVRNMDLKTYVKNFNGIEIFAVWSEGA